jgi:hypothetical protein
MCRARDAGGTVDVHADVGAIVDNRIAGMDPHPNSNLLTRGPGKLGESALTLGRGLYRFLGGGEDDVETVTFGAKLDTAMSGPRFAKHLALTIERVGIGAAKPRKQPRRALNVGKQQRHCS